MGVIRRFREQYRGREFWRGANKFIGISLYTILLVGIMAFPMYLGYLILGYVIVIPSYVAFFINHLREMEKKDKGNKVVEGWITHAYGVGERIYLYPTKFETVDKLPPSDLKAVLDYVVLLGEYDEASRSKTGLERFKPKQLTYKDQSEIEAMNNEEKRKFDEEETKEYDVLTRDYKEMKKHDQVKMTTTKEDESENEQ